MKKKIFIILPFKESLNPNKAGAVSIYVQDTFKHTKYKKYIKIINSDNLSNSKIFRNKKYINNFCEKYKNKKIDIIELHNRPEYLPYIKKNFPLTKIILIYHNDPIKLRGSQSFKDREYIVNNCDKIIFISRWIQQRFFINFKNANISDTEILYHGVKKEININLNKKNKNILFVGKLNHAKGYDIFVEAAKKFKKYNDEWNFIAIGTETRKKIFPDQKIVKEIGQIKNSEVLNYYKKSEISIGNSTWDEPLGRIAIESSSRKCLPIISNVAGLKESKNIAITLKNNNPTEIFKILKFFTNNKKYLRSKQNKFYKNNNFDIKKITKKLDLIRYKLFNNFKNKTYIKFPRILHIANFNEMSDGRLHYSFANKLNIGFIKNNFNVQTISDRNFLKSNRTFFGLNPFIKFNTKILNNLKNFSPDVLVLGHVFNLNKDVINHCKINNIKIISWYIDSISPEFLVDSKKKLFLQNLEFVDFCFITSSPKILKNIKNYKKLKFIPNPLDSSIDHYKNFNKKKLEYDVFVAISHGQNRAVLKKNKLDDREELINFATNELVKYKVAGFGLNGVEPIWGSNYFYYLSRSKIGLNISRGKYQELYSSDRISSLVGNGLLVFLDKKTKLHKILTTKDVIYFNNKKDLVKKLIKYINNENLRMKIAKSGYRKYHQFMNNVLVSRYIISKTGLVKSNKRYLWEI